MPGRKAGESLGGALPAFRPLGGWPRRSPGTPASAELPCPAPGGLEGSNRVRKMPEGPSRTNGPFKSGPVGPYRTHCPLRSGYFPKSNIWAPAVGARPHQARLRQARFRVQKAIGSSRDCEPEGPRANRGTPGGGPKRGGRGGMHACRSLFRLLLNYDFGCSRRQLCTMRLHHRSANRKWTRSPTTAAAHLEDEAENTSSFRACKHLWVSTFGA